MNKTAKVTNYMIVAMTDLHSSCGYYLDVDWMMTINQVWFMNKDENRTTVFVQTK